MLYVLKGQQVIAEIKGNSIGPVVELAYWAKNDKDLSKNEIDEFLIACAEEISQAAYTYNNMRIAAGGRREA